MKHRIRSPDVLLAENFVKELIAAGLGAQPERYSLRAKVMRKDLVISRMIRAG